MLTSYPDDDAVLSAIVAGASGYLLKQIRARDLVAALESVGRGESLLDPAVTEKVLERVRRIASGTYQDELSQLTAQEQKILMLVAEGKTNKEIAAELAGVDVARYRIYAALIGAAMLGLAGSTYAFTAMLLAFLLGLALGSAIFSRLLGARPLGLPVFAGLQLGVGLAALGILPVFERLPDAVIRALAVSLSPGFVLLVEVALAVAGMLAPTLLIGAGFPCAVQVAARGAMRTRAGANRPEAGTKISAVVSMVPRLPVPPSTSTEPSGNSVAV